MSTENTDTEVETTLTTLETENRIAPFQKMLEDLRDSPAPLNKEEINSLLLLLRGCVFIAAEQDIPMVVIALLEPSKAIGAGLEDISDDQVIRVVYNNLGMLTEDPHALFSTAMTRGLFEASSEEAPETSGDPA